MPVDKVTIFCFAASYSVALALELLQLFFPGRVQRLVMLGFAAAGLIAHTLYLLYHGLPLSGAPSSLLFLSWILSTFYLAGSLRHRGRAWGLFVLPVVLGLVIAAALKPVPSDIEALTEQPQLRPWAWLHFVLLLLGAVGLCVGFVASVMYLVQSYRLRHKALPGQGIQLLSLERLESMNNRAISLAFPLFTGGLIIGVALLLETEQLSWLDPKVLTAGLLWIVFALLVYLRYKRHEHGRRVAIWTIVAFACLFLAFVVQFFWPSDHPTGGGL